MISELPFLNLKIKCIAENKKNSNNGMVTGCNKKLFLKSPLSNSTKLLCNPQPGQSICKKYFTGQGNSCFSNHCNRPVNICNFLMDEAGFISLQKKFVSFNKQV